ncbi:hypothetical protein [Nocardioides sp. CFH 31398]|uniref:hypothetical protein n=1 Tax=Nocardioides sp. CFH 31398 TaxID=2919579 RepID=UPI001F063821|nr:hypothetical protein [Nocardioides sp. CFH 31398]MCH1867047.1 hypothetical protein [Nocardioides sp. CFH 31398]
MAHRTAHDRQEIPVRRATATALTALTVLGTVAAGTSPASADSGGLDDPWDDVAQFSDSGAAARGLGRAPADITQTWVDHRRNWVVSSIDIQDLERVPETIRIELALVTPDARYAAVATYSDEFVAFSFERNGEQAACEGMRRSLSPDGDYVIFLVPRSCLGEPHTVRFGSRTTRELEGGSQVDDGRRKEPVSRVDEPIRIGKRKLTRG